MSNYDLHLHTTASDGTDSPENLLRKIRELGIRRFAVTDHDTIAGALKLRGVEGFVFGIEFSCLYTHNRIHVLGLGVDPDNANFVEALRLGDELRHEKFLKRVKFLREKFGFNITDSDFEELSNIPGVGKPHLANLLVRKNYASNRSEAMRKFIDKCHTREYSLEAKFVINAILKSGGIPVWAHPLGGEGESESPREIFEAEFANMLSYGLRGLECYYSKYDFATCSELAKIARENDLLISGGSDYHGTNKNIPIGRLNSDEIDVSENMLSVLESLGGK